MLSYFNESKPSSIARSPLIAEVCYYRYEYHWCDGVNYKKPTQLPASKYIALLMDWVEAQINNEEIFPVKVGRFQLVYLCCVSCSYHHHMI